MSTVFVAFLADIVRRNRDRFGGGVVSPITLFLVSDRIIYFCLKSFPLDFLATIVHAYAHNFSKIIHVIGTEFIPSHGNGLSDEKF